MSASKRKPGILSSDKKEKIKEIIAFLKEKVERSDLKELKTMLEDLGRKMPKGTAASGESKKKRTTGYILFLAKFRKDNAGKYKAAEMISAGAKEWRNLDDDGKEKYNKKAKSAGGKSAGKKSSSKKSSGKKGSGKKGSGKKGSGKKGSGKKSSESIASLKKKLSKMTKGDCCRQPIGDLRKASGMGKGVTKPTMCEKIGAGKKS